MKKIFLLFVMMSLFSCNTNNYEDQHEEHEEHEEHSGHSHNPHYGGTLFEVGDHFAHIEVVIQNNSVTLYVLDGEAENSVYLKEPELKTTIVYQDKANEDVIINPVENPLTGETIGKSSQFISKDNIHSHDIMSITIHNIVIKGQSFKEITLKINE